MKESSTVPEEVKQRINWLLIFIIVSFCFLAINLWYLQVIKGEEFKERAVKNCIRSLVEEAPRGHIYDRKGEVLVTNRPVVVVSIIPEEVENLEELSKRLGGIIDLPEEVIREKVEKHSAEPFKPVEILEDCPLALTIEIEERKTELKGVVLEVKPRRNYLNQELAAHSLGYVGEIDQEELQKLGNPQLQGGDIVGKAGLEKYYDSFLRGKKGQKEVEVDALGREVATLFSQKPVAGNDLLLTMDKDLQTYAENLLEGKRGSIILSHPYSGEILVLANKPSFDPNWFTEEISYADWEKISLDPDYPLINRAVQSIYSPGSTFKIVTALAALEEGVTDSQRKIYCSGNFKLADQVFTCWKRGGHGNLNLIGALAHSCNVYFYTLGKELGVQKMGRYMDKLGLGEKVGIDLPAEATGVIPSPEWKQREFKEIWFPGDDVNLSIGQGYLLLTPLQMHSIICAVATAGDIYRPHLVKEIISPEGEVFEKTEPEISKKVNISANTFQLIQKGLRATILEGTGWQANTKELSLAGKTGTAQNPQGESHAWFVGFAPLEKPEVCITVFVENGGEGGEVAAPLAREMLEKYFNLPEPE